LALRNKAKQGKLIAGLRFQPIHQRLEVPLQHLVREGREGYRISSK